MTKVSQQTAVQLALRSARRLFFIIGFFSLFINVLMLVGPLYMLQIYDRVLVSQSHETLIALTIVAVGLIGVNAFLEFIRSRLFVRLGARFDKRLNEAVFMALFSHQLKTKKADGAKVLRDMDSLRSFLSGSSLNAFFDAPWTPFFLAIIFLFHPLLGLVALSGAIILFSLALISEFLTRGAHQRSSSAMGTANEFASSSLRNADAIRAMGMLDKVQKKWQSTHNQGLAWQGEAADRLGITSSLVKFVRPCLQIAILGFGAMLVLQEAITPGVMIAASIIMGRALAPVEMAINNWRQFVGARSSYGRLQKLLDHYQEETEPLALPKPEGKLSVESLVAKATSGGGSLLQGINFELKPGQALGVIGPSGAGKSTLARHLVGVWEPTSGHVRLDGADLTCWVSEDLGQHLGYLPQDIELLSGTVAENIARFTTPNPEEIVAAAKLCNAHEMILRLPKGYDTHIGESGTTLSGGQRQRIALARAVYGNPALIVLDEPNANLDNEGEVALQFALRRLRELKRTVIVISHRPSVLTEVDMVLLLRDGNQEAFGKREELLPRLVSSIKSTPPSTVVQQESSVGLSQ